MIANDEGIKNLTLDDLKTTTLQLQVIAWSFKTPKKSIF